jgi:hypothetical protein|tara:strand:- start:25 stop:132 length:108 start_codon:yes stop_codon:yes gene_type:complete
MNLNWQVVGQILSIGAVLLSGPAVIVLVSIRRGNL